MRAPLIRTAELELELRACAPRVDQEPPFDPALYCPKGHLRAEWEVERIDRTRASQRKRECRACKRDREPNRVRDQKAERKARALRRAACDALARAELELHAAGHELDKWAAALGELEREEP